MNTVFNSIAAAAAALEVKANTLSKQLKRGKNQVEMFDQKDREVVVKRNDDNTVSITLVDAPKPKRQPKEIPSHHVHTQKTDPRMSRMAGIEINDDQREPGIYVTNEDGTEGIFHNNTLAAAFAGCTVSRVSEIRRATKVRQLDACGSFTVALKNGSSIGMIRLDEIVWQRRTKKTGEAAE
jgi:hypothetical protein